MNYSFYSELKNKKNDEELENKFVKMEEEVSKDELRRRRENYLFIKAAVTSLTMVFKRQQNVDDLMLRSCLFVDKLGMVLEMASGMVKTIVDIEIEDNKLPETLRAQIDSLTTILKEELDALMLYCRQPSFSPDAPFGAHLVKNTGFYVNANKNDNL